MTYIVLGGALNSTHSLTLKAEKKVTDFSQTNCRQYVKQMHIYRQILREDQV